MSNEQSILAPALQKPAPVMAASCVANRLIGYISRGDETLRSQLYGRAGLSAGAPANVMNGSSD